jgi:hypothetical protein
VNNNTFTSSSVLHSLADPYRYGIERAALP